jgi:hypothetical protein
VREKKTDSQLSLPPRPPNQPSAIIREPDLVHLINLALNVNKSVDQAEQLAHHGSETVKCFLIERWRHEGDTKRVLINVCEGRSLQSFQQSPRTSVTSLPSLGS